MGKSGLNTHVFSQSMYNWLSLPVETGQIVEIPIPPVNGMNEVLVYISASMDAVCDGDHYYAVYTRARDGSPIPFHYLFLIGSSGFNSENLWLRMPDHDLPRVVYVQKMSGGALPPSAEFRSGVTVLTMR